MSWNIRPALSATLRNRTGPLLAAVQIAIALAVLVNAVYVVHQRIEKMGRPTGIDDRNLFQIFTQGFGTHYDANATLREDLTYLRSLPGVVDASPAVTVPMGWANQGNGIWTNPNAKGRPAMVTIYSMDEHGLNALGAHLIAGRNFRADEILAPVDMHNATDFVPEVIVTQSLARELYPGGSALGRPVYSQLGQPAAIIGITNDVIGPAWWATHYQPYDVIIVPRPMTAFGSGYLVRAAPGQRDRLMRLTEQHLAESNTDRVITWVKSIEFFKDRLYRDDLNMAIFLITVTVLVVAVACFGIFGLATYNVNTRTKQIGTRRAVGARRGDIIRYFMVENGAITTAGVVVGCVLALAVGYWLSVHYQLPRLDLYYLVGGILALWGIGQLAVVQPARRAAAIPPATATRTV
jgi:putative ABC transport system permease protein